MNSKLKVALKRFTLLSSSDTNCPELAGLVFARVRDKLHVWKQMVGRFWQLPSDVLRPLISPLQTSQEKVMKYCNLSAVAGLWVCECYLRRPMGASEPPGQ